MNVDEKEILKAYAEGLYDGHKLGFKQAKEEDVRLLKGKLCDEPLPTRVQEEI